MSKKRTNRTAAMLMICAFLLVGSACGKSNPAGGGTDASKPGGKNSEWAEKAGMYKTETVDELYEKAKQEGKVVVYSQSSRIKDVKASFEAKYPGIKVDAYNMTTNDIVEKVIREQGAGVFNSDVIFVKDAAGTVSTELTSKGLVHKYMPKDLTDKMVEPYKSKSPGLVPYVSLRAFYYNTEVYKEAPVKNWWDLTTPEWKGKVILEDPIQSADTMDLFLSIVQHADEMKQAYKEKFGKDIELNGTENAGYEFFKRILKNDPILVKSSDEAVDAVGAKGQSKPPIAVSASSKQRDIVEKGLKVATTYDIKPRLSVVGTNYLYVANNAPNPNAAKLMIRWLAGEADGKGEGFKPFNVQGSWSSRSDNGRTDQPSLDKIKVWDYDADYFYNNFIKFREFWLKNQ